MGQLLAGTGGGASGAASAGAAGAGGAMGTGARMIDALGQGLSAGGQGETVQQQQQTPNLITTDNGNSGRSMRNALLLQAMQQLRR